MSRKVKNRLLIEITIIILLLIIVVIQKNIERIDIFNEKMTYEKEEIELFSYVVYDNKDNINKILIDINSDNGIEYIITPNDNKILVNGKNNISIDYIIEENEEYIFKIKEINHDEISKNIKLNEESLNSTTISIEEEENTINGVKININNKIELDGYKLYYRFKQDNEWMETTGEILLDNTQLTDEVLNDENGITIYSKLENDNSSNIVTYSKKINLTNYIDFEYTGR